MIFEPRIHAERCAEAAQNRIAYTSLVANVVLQGALRHHGHGAVVDQRSIHNENLKRIARVRDRTLFTTRKAAT